MKQSRGQGANLAMKKQRVERRGQVRAWILIALMIYCLASALQLGNASSVAPPSFGLIRKTRRSFLLQQPNNSFPSFKAGLQQQQEEIVTNVVKRTTKKRPHNNKSTSSGPDSIWYYLKIALAGGIAGAVGSTALYPMDAAKTLRQSSPSEYASVFHALGNLLYTKSISGQLTWHVSRVYRGVIPAAVGAIPSSALYFGAYESMKAVLKRHFPLEGDESKEAVGKQQLRKNNFSNRLLVHALAAMSGNVLSSLVFVPKELIKQQLQYRQSGNVLGVVVDVLATKGLAGLYVGYKATLMRNIPTAVLRFSLYEEFRYRWTNSEERTSGIVNPKFFLAGAVAGILASGLMTPVDVIKTRLATGTCAVDIQNCFWGVVKEEGIVGLYSGAGSRMFFSGAFSAIGFGTFEWAKGILGVAKSSSSSQQLASTKSKTLQPPRTAKPAQASDKELEPKATKQPSSKVLMAASQ